MGLPMWKDPNEGIAEDTAAKLDRAAAQRRSTIRRETSVRPGRENQITSTLTNIIRHRHRSMRHDQLRLQRESLEADAQIAHLEAELERLRRTRLRNRSHLQQQSELARASREEFQSRETAAPSELTLVPDENSNPTTDDISLIVNDLDSSDTNLPRPVRESNLRFELQASQSHRLNSPWRFSSYIPSPPHSATDLVRDRSIPDGPVDSPAPISGANSSSTPESDSLEARNAEVDAQGLDSADAPGLETPPPEWWSRSFYPLRRVRHLSPRPRPVVDGLGDRRRSPSPSSADAQEEETWTNLLTTMGTARSSTATSFASATDATMQSGRSSQNTSTSFGEIGSADDTCELDLPPGITEADVQEMRARHRSRRTGPDGPMTGERGLREHRDRLAGRVETGMFHAILERMQRREDVPDDWWAMVGLRAEDVSRG